MQVAVDSKPTFSEKVKEGKRLFKSSNKARNATFKVVRSLMKDASHAGHCAYCEVDTGVETDHFKPVALFPGETFRPANYVPCCAICNKQKGERFPMFATSTTPVVVVHRKKRGVAILNSPTGVPALISPRTNSLLDFVELDLATFQYVINATPGTRDWAVADETIKLLKLNIRERLREKRQWAYDQYLAHLRDYVRDLATMSNPEKAKRKLAARNIHCRSVWEEMKRQGGTHPDLAPLFAATPDPMSW